MGAVGLKKRGTNPKRMPDRMLRFCFHYLESGNNTQSAINAGYSKKTAAAMAGKLLKDKRVSAFIGKAQREMCERLELTAEEVLRQLYFCATRDGKQLCDPNGILVLNHRVVNGRVSGTTIHDLPEQITAAIDGVKQKVRRYDEDGVFIEEVETEIKLVSKGGAIDMALKKMGMYAPTKVQTEVVKTDWDSLIVPGRIADSIEDRLIEEEK